MPNAQVVLNHRSAAYIPGIEPHRPALSGPQRLACYRATPRRDCPAVATALGVAQVWVKDESSRLGLPSFKMLGASYAAYRELCRLVGREPAWSDLAGLKRARSPPAALTL